MNDKLLINIYVPYLNSAYDMFIPYNEKMHIVINDIVKILNDLSDDRFDVSSEYVIFNRITGEMYLKNSIIINTNIRNGTQLILLREE